MTGLDATDFKGTDRFQVEGRLGAGGYGVVYRAMDRDRNVHVALKTFRHVAANALIRFKQEFRALADVSHPNLVALYELSAHEQQWFFTMELVDGVNFLWYVRGEAYPTDSAPTSALSPSGVESSADSGPVGPFQGALDLDRLRHALPQLVEGVSALHAAGKLHRDIKPSNVLVTREGRVVLLDFGLVMELAPKRSRTLDLVGTPAYMSPEQTAGRALTEASDWYNVGALLYQALTGRVPFDGPVAEVVRRKQESDPPPPRELVEGVPADLDLLCSRLLDRDPGQRPSGAEILGTLKGAAPLVAVPSSAASSPPLFVGRDEHLAALHAAFRTLKAGRASTVAVHGGSGMGKSALVRRFLGALKEGDPETVVLSGRCYERESVPYKALDALVDDLSRYLRRLPEGQAEAFLPHDILALARVFPVLRQVGAVNRARRAVLDIPDSLELRRRAFAALRELLVRLADRHPVVMFIDDLQWGDVDSAALLEDLMRPPEPPTLLLIGCYRSEEAETSPLLRTILPKRLTADPSLSMRDVVVGELSAKEAYALTSALVADERRPDPGRVEAIARESRGNPYFIEELVRFTVSDEPARDAPPAAAPADGAAVADVTLKQVIETRVSRVGEAARRLLEVVSVTGEPIELGVAYRAAELEAQGDSVLAVLRAAHLVRTRSTPGRQEVEPYHDRIRNVVLARIDAEALRECHHRLASALLASGRADPERLATHYLGAGDAESTAEYAALAAAKASDALAFDRAAGLYRFALNAREGTPAERAKLERQLGDALANAGRGAEAAQAYLSAAGGAAPAMRVDLLRRAALQFLISGYIEDGVRVLQTVLTSLGMGMPETSRRALVSLVLRRAHLHLRGLRFEERDESEIPAQDLLRIDTCWAVGVGMAMVDMVRGADFQARHLVLALRAGEPYRLARALAMEGAYVAMRGRSGRERSRRLIDASRRLAERVPQPYATALAALSSGNAAWLEGRWREAREQSERAEQLLRERCTGVDWEILISQAFNLASLFFLGEVGRLAQRVSLLLEEAEGRGNKLRATFLRVGFCAHVAWLVADDPARAREELDAGLAGWRQRGFDYLSLWVRGARTDIALYAGDEADVPERIGRRWRGFARSLDRFVQVGFIRGLDSRARRRLAAAVRTAGADERKDLLAGAERHAGTMLGERTPWGDPLAQLLLAGIAGMRGEVERAVGRLEAAEAGLTAADMALHAAVARRRRGQLLGGDTGRGLVSEADAWMAKQGIKSPERFAAMLAPGRW